MKKMVAFGLVLTMVCTLLLLPAFGLDKANTAAQPAGQNLLQSEVIENPSMGANEIASAFVVLGCMAAAALLALKAKKEKNR